MSSSLPISALFNNSVIQIKDWIILLPVSNWFEERLLTNFSKRQSKFTNSPSSPQTHILYPGSPPVYDIIFFKVTRDVFPRLRVPCSSPAPSTAEPGSLLASPAVTPVSGNSFCLLNVRIPQHSAFGLSLVNCHLWVDVLQISLF